MLDCQFWGLRPGRHRLTNVLLHLANAVLIFMVLASMTGTRWRSALVAGLFAWHPLHVESVAWVAGRKDVLSAFIWLLTLAERAAELTQGKNPSILDTLEVAFAKAGRFDEAVQTAEQAHALALSLNETQVAGTIAGHIELFRQHRPCRTER
jgi:hypothetical protein